MISDKDRLFRDAICKHPLIDVVRSRYIDAVWTPLPKSVDLTKLFEGEESSLEDFSLDQVLEAKALVLAHFIVLYYGHEDSTLLRSLFRSPAELKTIFLDAAQVTSLLQRNSLPVDRNPFSAYEMSKFESPDEEWEDMTRFSNVLKYGIHLTVHPPNKVVCMKAAAILTSFRKCLVGGWMKISTSVRRRHLLYQYISGDFRQRRMSGKETLQVQNAKPIPFVTRDQLDAQLSALKRSREEGAERQRYKVVVVPSHCNPNEATFVYKMLSPSELEARNPELEKAAADALLQLVDLF